MQLEIQRDANKGQSSDLDAELREFKNPRQWERVFGEYTIELADERAAQNLLLPATVTLEGNQLHIPLGAIGTPETRLSTKAKDSPLTLDIAVVTSDGGKNWPLPREGVKCIRRGGELFWVNPAYRNASPLETQ